MAANKFPNSTKVKAWTEKHVNTEDVEVEQEQETNKEGKKKVKKVIKGKKGEKKGE